MDFALTELLESYNVISEDVRRDISKSLSNGRKVNNLLKSIGDISWDTMDLFPKKSHHYANGIMKPNTCNFDEYLKVLRANGFYHQKRTKQILKVFKEDGRYVTNITDLFLLRGTVHSGVGNLSRILGRIGFFF